MKEPPERESVIKAQTEFQIAFGQALFNWSGIERGLFWQFAIHTAIPERMARAVYYSARNATARFDMLSASLRHSSADNITVAFAKGALKRARSYNSLRNTLAHGEAFIGGTTRKMDVRLVEGGLPWDEAMNAGISAQTLRVIATNFERLALVLSDLYLYQSRDGVGLDESKSPKGCLERVLRLPIVANAETLSPTPKG